VFPLSERMTERFQDEGYAGNVTVDSIGSGAGFERFCVGGETDLSNASRGIKDSEVESCREIGREPIEFRVGTDALAVVVSQENEFIEDASFDELAATFSSAAEAWSDEEILRFIPGTDSGTFDFFVEEVFDKDETPILSAANTEVLRVLSIEGVEPTAETVDSADYLLARPLFIYSTASIMQEKPQMASFVNFYLTYVNEEVVDVGYFPARAEALDAAKQA
jgi:phosphate transport system substrate-binding protein